MAKKLHVKGYDAFIEISKQFAGQDNSVFVLFSGSKDENGQSWCPDCVAAAPVICAALKQASEDAIFVHCEVGDRAFWKDQENSFRKDATLKLTAVPTLLKLGSAQKLVEEQCLDKNLVEMMFEED